MVQNIINSSFNQESTSLTGNEDQLIAFLTDYQNIFETKKQFYADRGYDFAIEILIDEDVIVQEKESFLLITDQLKPSLLYKPNKILEGHFKEQIYHFYEVYLKYNLSQFEIYIEASFSCSCAYMFIDYLQTLYFFYLENKALFNHMW